VVSCALVKTAIDIVLVRPIHAGNVGSVARAMQNCGFGQLVIVGSHWPEWPLEARQMASGANEVLDQARFVPTVAEALAPYWRAAATTARPRHGGPAMLNHRELYRHLCPQEANGPVAVVFGPEDKGLATEDMELCQLSVHIPSSVHHSSFNLSQAVLLVCYELFWSLNVQSTQPAELLDHSAGREEAEPASLAELGGFFEHMVRMLGRVGYLNPQNPDHIIGVLRQVYLRARMDPREVRIFRGMIRQIEWAVGRTAPPDEDPGEGGV
jgi:tRNA/rRNA methyltransferase